VSLRLVTERDALVNSGSPGHRVPAKASRLTRGFKDGSCCSELPQQTQTHERRSGPRFERVKKKAGSIVPQTWTFQDRYGVAIT
jgi:hypothetical protein